MAVLTLLFKPQQDLPFVEFDMRKQPPTVQSANVMFCSLLGYRTEEVLGKPWQYFIQDDYVERTIRMLQRDHGARQMRFGQVYKDRNGKSVPCQDLHTFNRDERGRVITGKHIHSHSHSHSLFLSLSLSSFFILICFSRLCGCASGRLTCRRR